jgi:2-aminoadipate transaminase
MDCQKLFQAALKENVAFVPGDCFYPRNGKEPSPHMRLNFSNATTEQIREGIRRLSVAIKNQIQEYHLSSVG